MDNNIITVLNNNSENSFTFSRPVGFDLNQIFDCGQSFRFSPCGANSFSGIAHGKYIIISQTDSAVTIDGCAAEDFESIWKNYFCLDVDYNTIRSKIVSIRPNDPVLTEAMEYGKGIRLLRQDKWETLCSFIISQNNNIPRIRSLIEAISEKYGNKIIHNDKIYYSFPTAEVIANAGVDALRSLKVGFRAPYIIDAATKVANREIDLEQLDSLQTDELLKQLMTIKGVGLKVASCVTLFAYGRLDSFPIDVWIKRVLEKHYPEGFDHTVLGNTAGLVQQYLFYYERYRNS